MIGAQSVKSSLLGYDWLIDWFSICCPSCLKKDGQEGNKMHTGVGCFLIPLTNYKIPHLHWGSRPVGRATSSGPFQRPKRFVLILPQVTQCSRGLEPCQKRLFWTPSAGIDRQGLQHALLLVQVGWTNPMVPQIFFMDFVLYKLACNTFFLYFPILFIYFLKKNSQGLKKYGTSFGERIPIEFQKQSLMFTMKNSCQNMSLRHPLHFFSI